ncbi:pectin acetylesterase 5-like [Punica granatum]|uniref:Pectin acetylesterase n=2 Tax=Punica granatum TaxID=22663 RepID=A0A218VXN2_PUNGR|nr:pectin acetylesterase 5-like [Punica granatum]OWM64632.1 hypothetical protein CDL15_Pgr020599 [Punica granatum]PKI39377.1 hypothetical protein CRG98_040243 [Punica granatum]
MLNPRVRALIRSRKWAKKDWAIAAVGLSIILVALYSLTGSLRRAPLPYDLTPTAALVELTLLRNARDLGALCLDGSAPGYHFQRGYGSGSSNWVIHIEGGGWCDSLSSCSSRAGTALGSSKYMDKQVPFSGILSNQPSENPDFFNWNRVKIRYCDGASLAGHPESELKGHRLFFRGQLIWKAIMDELLSAGMSGAKQALLSGCSAGGLATLIHCDDFRELLPKVTTVKCLADAGFFLDEKDISGNRTMRSFYHNVVQLQGVAKSLNQDCVTKTEPSKCMFPEEIVKHIRTPVFLVNPAYDFWQIQHILVPQTSDPNRNWQACRLNIRACSPSLLEVLQGFRGSLLKALSELQEIKESGLFINSCFIHCQTWLTETWHSQNSPRINTKTIAESVGDWYFNRKEVKRIDCPYPCNPSCYNMVFG